MTEKELIAKLQELRQIKAPTDWVNFTKERIFANETSRGERFLSLIEFLPHLLNRRVFAPALLGLLVVVFLSFSLMQSALPGDLLYHLKKITENSRAVFVSPEELPEFSLELANKRLAELNQIVEKNQTKKLAPAINEVQHTLAQMAQVLLTFQATSSDAAAIDKFVKETESIKNEIQSLKERGIAIDDNDLEKVSEGLKCKLLSLLVADLEKRTLNDEQAVAAQEIKKIADEGKCQEGLELFLMKFNQKNNFDK
jgi:hypothetical protein